MTLKSDANKVPSERLKFCARLHTHNFNPSVASSDYNALTNFNLGPFSNDLRELSFNVSIVDDHIPEDAEIFSTNLTLDSAGQDQLRNRVIVSPAIAAVTIQDDGKQL